MFRACDKIYEVKSGLPRNPGNGGNGGRGGFGGKAGQILIISMDQKPEIVTISRDGTMQGYQFFYLHYFFWLFMNFSICLFR